MYYFEKMLRDWINWNIKIKIINLERECILKKIWIKVRFEGKDLVMY